jgi:selT/selW/selH-like putative selenoprotein
LAAAVEKKYSIKPKLIKSGGGAFEVLVDGKKIFSKKDSGRFPTDQEILEAIPVK